MLKIRRIPLRIEDAFLKGIQRREEALASLSECNHSVATQLREKADQEFDRGHPAMGAWLRDRADELDAGLKQV